MTVTLRDVVAADGHGFQTREFAAAARARAGLVWIPALGVSAGKYDPLAAALAARGVEVVIHEWRGMGSSGLRAGRGRDWNYSALLADLEATRATLDPARAWYFGGHSLGAQFAAMLAARQPAACVGLVLLAAGVPAPDTFRGRYRLGVALLARLIPGIVGTAGYFPGHRLRFAGREAAGVMRDWAASARRGGYADYGDGRTMESLLAATSLPALALVMADDWMGPEASMRRLLGKFAGGAHALERLDAHELGVAADHFRWMRAPDPVAARIAGWIGHESHGGAIRPRQRDAQDYGANQFLKSR